MLAARGWLAKLLEASKLHSRKTAKEAALTSTPSCVGWGSLQSLSHNVGQADLPVLDAEETHYRLKP